MIQFEIPEPTPLLNELLRMHWHKRKRMAKGIAWMVREALGPWSKPPIEKCSILIERHSSGIPDRDGMVGGCKLLLDTLVKCSARNPHGLGIIADDNPEVIEELNVVAVKCKRGEGKTRVTILEVMK